MEIKSWKDFYESLKHEEAPKNKTIDPKVSEERKKREERNKEIAKENLKKIEGKKIGSTFERYQALVGCIHCHGDKKIMNPEYETINKKFFDLIEELVKEGIAYPAAKRIAKKYLDPEQTGIKKYIPCPHCE